MFSEPKQMVSDIIRRSLRNMRFEERLAEGLANCVEGHVWEEFMDMSKEKMNVELDFRVTFRDVSGGEDKREFLVGVNSIINGQVISPEVLKEVMKMAQEKEPVEYCDCDQPLFKEDRIHCTFCGRVINARPKVT